MQRKYQANYKFSIFSLNFSLIFMFIPFFLNTYNMHIMEYKAKRRSGKIAKTRNIFAIDFLRKILPQKSLMLCLNFCARYSLCTIRKLLNS